MVAEIKIKGGADFQRLARQLREAGTVGKGLQRELYKRIHAATLPLRDEVKKAESEQLPRRGGLAKLVARQRFQTLQRSRGREAGIRLTQTGTKVKNLVGEDAGTIRHPVFGNRSAWVSQKVNAGTWTKTLGSSKSQKIVKKEIHAAIDEISKKLT